MRVLILLFFLATHLLVPAQVQQAYLDEDGRVMVRTLNDFNLDLPPTNNRLISQMPGFPKKIPAHPNFKNFRNVTLADLNGDGKQEILAASLNALRVFGHDGQLLWSKPLTGTPIYPPSVAAIDGSASLGIVQVTGGVPNNGRVYLFDAQGNTMPGWPVNFSNHWILCAPAIADVNNDGQKEIIVQTRTSNNLHVLRLDGTVLWSYNLGGTPAITPSVGDLDGDGIPDIVTGTSNGNLFAFDGLAGTLKPGYPVVSQNYSLSYQSPLLVDLDGNGTLSIVGSTHGDAPHYYVRNFDGTYRTGWPVAVDENSWTYSPPAVVDLSGNNDFRIFASRPIGEEPKPMLYGFNPDGSLMPNFPIVKAGGLESTICVADITGDGSHELIFGSNLMVGGQGFIHAYHIETGQQVEGFPLRPTGFTYMNGASLGDVNGDGMLDLVALSYEQTFSASDSAYINVYELNIPAGQANVRFGTYKGSNDRTGFIARTALPAFPVPQNFSAIVNQNNVELSWQAPDLSGTSFVLDGYKLWQNDEFIGQYGPNTNNVLIQNLPQGVHYFALKATYTAPVPGESQAVVIAVDIVTSLAENQKPLIIRHYPGEQTIRILGENLLSGDIISPDGKSVHSATSRDNHRLELRTNGYQGLAFIILRFTDGTNHSLKLLIR
ncbi:MAG: VCBS repeat-containing protein [Bacteroidetes bacterium]|nr:VCBS repeat-containing protein [Bacteroidota bacterium]